ncbi:MAG: HAMP domain-containing sensor histidine kinase [Flavobacteriales bacterium]|jgi:signal transduction histidine kinase|nr:HAMP domain-containing sensor histidine kinase [Flavobacteriales bacterium]
MKLLDRSLLHLSVALLLALAVWATAFFFVMRNAVLHSIDEGLEEQQEMILHRVEQDPATLQVTDLGLHGFAITPTDDKVKDRYRDTLLYVPAEGEVEKVRLMSSDFKHDGQRYRLLVFTSTVEEDDLLESLLIGLIALYVLVLITIVVVHNVVLRHVWRPFHAILGQIKGFRLGSGTALQHVRTDTHEFKELKAAADALVRHASSAYAQQRAFTENAAHELQTPLAIAINKLELLAEEGGDEAQRMAAVGECIGLLERIARLNRSLLLLARIENRQFPEERDIAFTPLARDVLAEFADLADHRQVAMDLQADGDFTRRMDPGLARILVTNLVKNAIMHNVPGGQLRMHLTGERITVSNTGKPEPLDADRIFDRFHKATTADAGTGLGLAIVKAIAGMYALRVAYRYTGEHEIVVEG